MLNSRRRGDSDDEGAAPPVNHRNSIATSTVGIPVSSTPISPSNTNTNTSSSGASSNLSLPTTASRQQSAPVSSRYSMIEPKNESMPSRWVLGDRDRAMVKVTSSAGGASSLQLSHGPSGDPLSLTVRTTNNSSSDGKQRTTLVVADHAIPVEYLKETALKRRDPLCSPNGESSSGAGSNNFDQMLSNLRIKPFSAPITTASSSSTGFQRSVSSSLYPPLPGETRTNSTRDIFANKKGSNHSRSNSPVPPSSRTPKSTSSPVYYFEVTIQSLPSNEDSVLSIGMVVSDGPSSSEENDNMPGKIINSIGLTSRGELNVSGRTVDEKKCSFEGFQAGDVIGCGLEVLGTRRILFTKNGKTILAPTRFHDVDPKNFAYSPSIGIMLTAPAGTAAVSVSGDFGTDTKQTFQWEESEVAHIVNANFNVGSTDRKSAPNTAVDPQRHSRNALQQQATPVSSIYPTESNKEGLFPGDRGNVTVGVAAAGSHDVFARDNNKASIADASPSDTKEVSSGAMPSIFGSKPGKKSMLDDDDDDSAEEENKVNYRTGNSVEYQEPQPSRRVGAETSPPGIQNAPSIPREHQSLLRGRDSSSLSSLAKEALPVKAKSAAKQTTAKSKSPTRRLFGFGRSKKMPSQESGATEPDVVALEPPKDSSRSQSPQYFGRGKKKSNLLDDDDDEEEDADIARVTESSKKLSAECSSELSQVAPAPTATAAAAPALPTFFGTKSKKSSLDDDISANTAINNHMTPVRAQSAQAANISVTQVSLNAAQSTTAAALGSSALFGKKSKKSSLDDDNPVDVQLQSTISNSFPSGTSPPQSQPRDPTTVSSGVVQTSYGTSQSISQSSPAVFGSKTNTSSLEDDDEGYGTHQLQSSISTMPPTLQGHMLYGRKSKRGSLEDDDPNENQQGAFARMPASSGSVVFGTKSNRSSLDDDDDDDEDNKQRLSYNTAVFPATAFSGGNPLFVGRKSRRGSRADDDDDLDGTQQRFAPMQQTPNYPAVFGAKGNASRPEGNDSFANRQTQRNIGNIQSNSGNTMVYGRRSKRNSLDDEGHDDIQVQGNVANLMAPPISDLAAHTSGAGRTPIFLGSKSKRGNLEDDDDEEDGEAANGMQSQQITTSSLRHNNRISSSQGREHQTMPATDTIQSGLVQAGHFTREPSRPMGLRESFTSSSAGTGTEVQRRDSESRRQSASTSHRHNWARSTVPLSAGVPSNLVAREPSASESTNDVPPTLDQKGVHTDVGSTSEEELLSAAIKESKRVQKKEETKDQGTVSEPLKDVETIKENARTLRSVCTDDRAEFSILDSLLNCCRNHQNKIQACLESEDPQFDLGELLSLNELVLDAIRMGETLMDGSKKRSSSSRGSSKTSLNLDIDALVEKKDIFSLICILRAQSDQRLDAALALMDLAKEADNLAEAGTRGLRDEIRSSGGMHSLVTVFRSKGVSYELRVVSALAVAYALPSLVESSSIHPSVGLKVMECLRFLSTARSVSPKERRISRQEMYKAAAMGVTSFWINELTPMLNPGAAKGEGSVERSNLISIKSKKRPRRGRQGGQRHQALELQELLEMTVSLIVEIERLGETEDLNNYEPTDSLFLWRYTNVEQVCAVDVARPIAVREGLLPILIGWIRSKDREKIRPAISALRYLTSIEDDYMAGWIHSQMVNEGALAEVVKLADDYYAGQDVRLAVAQILSSLCVAPHTRAAVVEAKCINYLLGFLYDHSDISAQEVALFAGRAIMQLAQGAITHAGVMNDGDMDPQDNGFPPDKSDTLVDDIVNSGAISSFISIATEHDGRLRSMAIEAMRVLSEDSSSRRRTRIQLCEEGAANSLGRTLQDDVKELHDAIKFSSRGKSEDVVRSIIELHDALCTLANILEPIQPKNSTSPKLLFVPSYSDPTQHLIRGCIQIVESGGLDSLLWIVSIPLATQPVWDSPKTEAQFVDLLEEACRSLASLSPLLLSKEPALRGYSCCAGRVFEAFDRILKLAPVDDVDSSDLDIEKEALLEMNVSALRGLGALASAEPLKIRIVDRTLPTLLQMRNSQNGRSDISTVAGQVFLSLGFEEDEIAVQVAGSNPNLLADWFCLQRSLLIQAMARSELRRLLLHIWGLPFEALKQGDRGVTRLLRNISLAKPKDQSMAAMIGSFAESFGETDLFENIFGDDDTEELRRTIVKQYRDFYGPGASTGSRLTFESLAATQDKSSLLARHVYPLDEAQTEIDWILSHDQSIYSQLKKASSLFCGVSSPEHVTALLDCCFPSRLLRDSVVPIFNLKPEASFNFRALNMPQRRYFSFRREGQLISRLCDKQSESLDFDDVHWTLVFMNSTFAGEFSETLVQALYLCPTIRGLTFGQNKDFLRLREIEGDDDDADGGSSFIASLVGSLPPWIHSLTFSNMFNDDDVKALVRIIETMGKLTSDQAIKAASMGGYSSSGKGSQMMSAQAHGKLWNLAICSSPAVSPDTWLSLFGLLGRVDALSSKITALPLSSLKVLDLSFNNLGDETCAFLLEVIHDPESGCTLEQLDLSGNGIRKGVGVLSVLYRYVEDFRYDSAATARGDRKRWQSSLQTLNLSANELSIGRAGVELVSLLKHDSLSLKVLDLSSNGFGPQNVERELCKVLISTLSQNTLLYHLNLSGNSFSSEVVDKLLSELGGAAMGSCLSFLGLDNNRDPLTQTQLSLLQDFMHKTRQNALQGCLRERNAIGPGVLEDSVDLAETNHSRLSNYQPSSDLSTIISKDGSTFTSSKDGFDEVTRQPGDTMITVLFSAPLVFTNERRQLKPFAKLDFDMERELLWQCMKEASRDIELSFDNATHDRLLAAITKRCSCLHYSGHGHPSYLPFEDGGGGPNWFKVEDIQRLIARESAAPFKFVFVSACHSGLAGETFASAGVPHVVCCQQEFELKDTAALAFTRQFYLSLVIGHTVRESFDQGCKAVRATPNLHEPEKEMKKFLLLPKGGNHDVPIFNARAVPEWPKDNVRHRLRLSKKGKSFRHLRNLHTGGARSSELSVRNMMQEDPSPTPPQFFLGREVEMYYVLKAILAKRLVSVVAEPGLGRSSLVCALCHYINERASTIIAIERIYFVKAKRTRRLDGCRALMEQLLKKLVESGKEDLPDTGLDMEDVLEFICKALKNEKALVVFDRMEYLENSEDEEEFPMLLSALFRGTKHVKVIITGRRPLGIPSLGGQVEYPFPLGPLTFENSLRLFANLCPHLHTAGERHKLFEQLATDGEQSELRPSDTGINERTKAVFKIIGDGIPSRIEQTAYEISSEALRDMLEGYGGQR